MGSTTVSGETCQEWALDTPHSHTHHDLPSNFCRNPDGAAGPWCYTMDAAERWELCDIPLCDSPPSPPPSPKPPPSPPPSPKPPPSPRPPPSTSPPPPLPPSFSTIVTGCDPPVPYGEAPYAGAATWVVTDECAAQGEAYPCNINAYGYSDTRRQSCGTVCGARGQTCDVAGLRAVWYETGCAFLSCALESNAQCNTWTPGYPEAEAFPGLNYRQSRSHLYHGVISQDNIRSFTCDMQPIGTQKVLCPCV